MSASAIPSSIILWHELPRNIKEVRLRNSFKFNVRVHLGVRKTLWNPQSWTLNKAKCDSEHTYSHITFIMSLTHPVAVVSGHRQLIYYEIKVFGCHGNNCISSPRLPDHSFSTDLMYKIMLYNCRWYSCIILKMSIPLLPWQPISHISGRIPTFILPHLCS
jgi:hypothetical protein